MTDSLIEKLEAKICGDYTEHEAYGRGLDQGFRIAIELIRQHQAEYVCPYVVTNDEGTAYCRLAEQSNSNNEQRIGNVNAKIPKNLNANQPQEVVERVAAKPTGLCSAHRFGEDSDCKACYPHAASSGYSVKEDKDIE